LAGWPRQSNSPRAGGVSRTISESGRLRDAHLIRKPSPFTLEPLLLPIGLVGEHHAAEHTPPPPALRFGLRNGVRCEHSASTAETVFSFREKEKPRFRGFS
jgi:hypothetical protein